MRTYCLLHVFVFLLVLAACGDDHVASIGAMQVFPLESPPAETPTPSPTGIPNPSILPSPTASPRPSASPSPTASPIPSASPSPTASPRPSATPSPTVSPTPSSPPPPGEGPLVRGKSVCSEDWTTSAFLFQIDSQGQIVPKDLPVARITVVDGSNLLYDGPLNLTYTQVPFSMTIRLPVLSIPSSQKVDWFICKLKPGQQDCRHNSVNYGTEVGSTLIEFYEYENKAKIYASINELVASGISLMSFQIPRGIRRDTGNNSLFSYCTDYNSPLILDLKGNEIHLNGPYNSGVRFDLNANGRRERTGWVKSNNDDAFLARDLNRNGRIDNGRELFGNYTQLKTGALAANGFEALKDLDLNKDGIFEPGEASDVQLWLDANANGATDSKELHSLAEYQITKIALKYISSTQQDAYGNQSRQQSRFYSPRGWTNLIADIWFFVLPD